MAGRANNSGRAQVNSTATWQRHWQWPTLTGQWRAVACLQHNILMPIPRGPLFVARLHIMHFKIDFKCVLGCISLDISQVMYVYLQKSIFQVISPSKFCVSAPLKT